jgi:hypothetical protein
MSGHTIDDLPSVSTATRIRLLGGEYPNMRVWAPIDHHRSRILRVAAANQPPSARADMLDLACRLRFSGNDAPPTLASYFHTFELSLRFAAAFLQLAERDAWPMSFRIYPPGLEFPAHELEEVDFSYICDRLRRTFDRVAGSGADGYVVAVARGEYNVVNDSYRLYFRGLAFGDFADAVRWIIELDAYDAPWQDNFSPPFLRVSWRPIRRGDVSKLLRLVPTEWQRIYEAPHGRELVRQNLWSELPPRRMAQLLLFWDRLMLRDITLLMRLRVASDGLRLTAKGRGKRLLKPVGIRKVTA